MRREDDDDDDDNDDYGGPSLEPAEPGTSDGPRPFSGSRAVSPCLTKRAAVQSSNRDVSLVSGGRIPGKISLSFSPSLLFILQRHAKAKML